MELRTFAERILFSDTLATKLERIQPPLTDEKPGSPLRVLEPIRPANLVFAPPRTAPSMPHPSNLHLPLKRAVAHHILANHELQALEVMAWVLLAFPEAPVAFRMGLAEVMADEQRHTRMHADHAASLGIQFGELPVNCYIWKKSQEFQSVLDYLAGIPLTFEGRTLDHTLEFEEYFQTAGDPKGAAIMKAIHRDEIHHVAFGLKWLRILKPADLTDWEAYSQHLHWPLRPDKSIGDVFHRQPRLAAGMTDEFIDRLREDPPTQSLPKKPNSI